MAVLREVPVPIQIGIRKTESCKIFRIFLSSTINFLCFARDDEFKKGNKEFLHKENPSPILGVREIVREMKKGYPSTILVLLHQTETDILTLEHLQLNLTTLTLTLILRSETHHLFFETWIKVEAWNSVHISFIV